MTVGCLPSTIVVFTLLFVRLFMPNTAVTPHDNSSIPAIRAYLGGSFDPVHEGHVQMAMIVYRHLLPIARQQQRDLRVSLLPNARSPFKTHSTDPEHRLSMLKLATQDTPLQIDELELWQAPPVYTIDSVRTLRQRYPHDALIFMMGMDSARSLDQWKDGLKLTDYVNLWIFSRVGMTGTHSTLVEPSHSLTEKDLVAQETIIKEAVIKETTSKKAMALPTSLKPLIIDSPIELVTPNTQNPTINKRLKNAYKGHIYIDSHPVMTVSSTQIRQQLQMMDSRADIMSQADTQITSAAPINAIMTDTPSNSFAKWLNPAVYHYIIAHQLYSAAQFR